MIGLIVSPGVFMSRMTRSAFCSIAVRRDFFESVVVADYALESAERVTAEVSSPVRRADAPKAAA